jgi:hypothetical protein
MTENNNVFYEDEITDEDFEVFIKAFFGTNNKGVGFNFE